MKVIRTSLLSIALVLVAGLAQATDVTRQIPVTDDFIEGKMGWNVGGRGFVYRIKFIEAGGIIELCGAVAYVNAQSRSASKRFLRDSAFVINGQKVIKDLSYWNSAGTVAQLGSSMANCASTGVSANTRINDLDIAWSRRSYRF